MYKSIFLIAFAIACYSCQESTSTQPLEADKSTAKNAAADIDSIRSLFQAVIHAATTVDADKMMNTYSRSEKVAFIDADGVIHGPYDSLHNTLKQIYSGLKFQSAKFNDDLDVQMLSDKYAMAVTNGQFNGETKDGKKFSGDLALTMIFVREPSGWKILTAHQSDKMKE